MRLSTNRVQAIVDNRRGGRLASFKLDGQELLVTQGDGPTEWGCYPMAPWAGRIRNGTFTWRNEKIQLPLRLPPHALHGTVLDRTWNQIDERTIETDFGEDWPLGGSVRSTFTLEACSFTWAMTVMASSSETPVTVGWHPWFRRRLDSGATGQLMFDAAHMYIRDVDGIPTGQLQPPSPGPWDDCFSGISGPVRVEWSNGLGVTIESSCSHWVVYDMPEHAICIEPQSGPPDAVRLGRFDLVTPRRKLTHSMRWSWV